MFQNQKLMSGVKPTKSGISFQNQKLIAGVKNTIRKMNSSKTMTDGRCRTQQKEKIFSTNKY